MADSFGRANSRGNGQDRGDTDRRGAPASMGEDDFLAAPNGLRSADSRFSLNEQFATSRREFEFDEEDEALEPAPIIVSPATGPHYEEDDTDNDGNIGDDELRRLLTVNENTLDFYTLLGLSRESNPSTTQIRSSYHRLSLAFHPDKHPQSLKAAAERHFTRLQRAYETLIDPRKRVIYDLEGEIGLQQEFRPGGTMGQGGEAERQIGVRTMNATEFREWFMGILRDRERRAIQELVGTSGVCKLTLNAHNLFNESDDVLRFQPPGVDGKVIDRVVELPAPKVTAQMLQLQQSFTVPILGLGRVLRTPIPPFKSLFQVLYRGNDREDGQDFESKWQDTIAPDVPRLIFTGAIAGNLKQVLALNMEDIEDPVGSKSALKPVQWYSLNSERMDLSVRLEHSFRDTKVEDGSIASRLQGTDIDVTSGLFPGRSIAVGLGRALTLIKDTQPIYWYLRTNFTQPLTVRPPAIDFRMSRYLGRNQTVYLQASTGEFPWPASFYERFLFFQQSPLLSRDNDRTSMRLGYVWTESASALAGAAEDDDSFGFQADDNGSVELIKKSSANPSWHLSAEASPINAAISIRYGRDIFAAKKEPLLRSRVRNSGDAIPNSSHTQMRTSRGVRLEIRAELSALSMLDTSVRAVRRVGDFSTIGFGVGISTLRGGLYMTLSWSRLGQSIVLPVMLVPAEEVTQKAVMWALTIPWATYAALEFAVLRPRNRRKRRRLVEKKRREMRENVALRRAEAEQAVFLMRPLIESRQALEREHGGLVILRASYGVRERGSRGKHMWVVGEVADVTYALAALVVDGQLSLARGLHKDQIIGFYDPSPLKKKSLAVQYLYGGREHYVEVDGSEVFSIPMRSHGVTPDLR